MANDVLSSAPVEKIVDIVNDPIGLIDIEVVLGNPQDNLMNEITVKEINMSESLLTPGLQTSLTIQSYIYVDPPKDFEKLKNAPLKINLKRRGVMGPSYNISTTMIVDQTIYRMENRESIPYNISQTEEFTIHACDTSLIEDAKKLVSKSWKCTRPSEIVKNVLEKCVGVSSDNMDIDEADPARDYIAENIHPFQVISQQCNVSLYRDDPSFVHYMTYGPYDEIDPTDAKPMHYFRSLKKMCEENAVIRYRYGETGTGIPTAKDSNLIAKGGYQSKDVIITMKFPCDFDSLVDTLNGIDENGQNQNSLGTFNPTQKSFSLLGNQSNGCGVGGYNYKVAVTNQGSAEKQNSCNLDVESHLLKRQARMSLIDRDRIALRITVPWNPGLHVGMVIGVDWPNKYGSQDKKVYGSGDYLILHLTHTVRMGGFSVTTMDCVSRNVGQGAT